MLILKQRTITYRKWCSRRCDGYLVEENADSAERVKKQEKLSRIADRLTKNRYFAKNKIDTQEMPGVSDINEGDLTKSEG